MEPDEGRNVDQAAPPANAESHIVEGHRSNRRAGSGPVADASPYLGLASYGRANAEWFFGRDRVLAELIKRLDQGGGPVVVVAPSGAGKTSLLQAGLIPKLEHGTLPGSRHWPLLRITPGNRPIFSLANAIAALTGTPVDQVLRQLEDPDRFVETMRGFLRQQGEGTRMVVIVDQLEELFTMSTDRQESRKFVDLISRLANRGPVWQDPVALVVYGLRADFYAQSAEFPQLRAALQDNQLFLGPMASSELREAIELPAQRAGLKVEPGLVELLLRDLGVTTVNRTSDEYAAGALPLLAYALRVTWERRHSDTLTVQGYQDGGSIASAVATSAEAVFASFNAEEQHAARTLFLRLVRIGDGTEDTRQRVPRDELVGDGADRRTAMTVVLEAYTQHRLITQGWDSVEITHEALIRAWPRLRHWIDADRAGNLIRQQLYEAAALWARAGRDPSALYWGTRLQAAREWVSSQPDRDGLGPIVTAFLTMSIRDAVRRRTLRLTAPSLLALSVMALLLVAVMPMDSNVSVPVWWWKLALGVLLALIAAMAAVATAATSTNQIIGRCWRAVTRAFGLVAPKPVPSPSCDQLERAALHDLSGAYRDVMTELDEILELRATAAADQAGGVR